MVLEVNIGRYTYDDILKAARKTIPMPEFFPRPEIDHYRDLERGDYGAGSIDETMRYLTSGYIESEIEKLFFYFGISPNREDSWPTLALVLACRYIEGFDPEKRSGKSGAPKKWGPSEDAFIYSWIRLAENENPTPKKKDLFAQIPPQLNALLGGSLTPSSVRDAYYRASNEPDVVAWEKEQRSLFGDDWMAEALKKRIRISWEITWATQRVLPILQWSESPSSSEIE